jgi:uncharacterized membrane protein YcaP (DUF421 family)
MDPLRVGVRVLLAYLILLLLLRLSGKRTVYQGTPFDFVLALILGDMVDDVLWSEVPVSQFIVAIASLVFMKLTLTYRPRRALRQDPVGSVADRGSAR